jgi:trehalose-phosphatase
MSGAAVPVIRGIPDFWQRIRSAPHCVLALDYDGTLAPFQIDRRTAVPLDGVIDLLKWFQADRRTTVAIISGRPLSELVELLGDHLAIPLFGAHGYEYLAADRTFYCSEINSVHNEGLEDCWNLAREAGFSRLMERKVAAIAVHFREFEDASQQSLLIRNLWEPVAAKCGLVIDEFNGGLEVKTALIHKGTAVARLLEGSPAGSLCVYLGDDRTDEDAFIYLKGRGLGIKVGGTPENTAADGWVENSEAVRSILEAWQLVGQ